VRKRDPGRALPLLLLLAGGAGGEEPPAPAPRFTECAAERGLAGIEPYRILLTDLDDDGWSEALVQQRAGGHPGNPGGPVRVFANRCDPQGGRRFQEVPGSVPRFADAGPDPEARPTGVFVVAGDLDGDGRTDLFRACYQEPADHPEAPDTGERSAWLRGIGDPGTPRFALVPESGVGADGPVTTCGAAFLDADRDGDLDLFVGNWYQRFGRGLLAHPDRLYRNDGAGRFSDATAEAGLLTKPTVGEPDSHRPTYGVSHGDFDGDGWPDIFTATYGRQANRLWRNRGDGTFEDWAPRVGFDGDAERSGAYPEWIRENPRLADRRTEPPFRAHGNSFSAVPADFDADGDLDLFVAEITHGWTGPSSDLSALLVNEGPTADPPFRLRRVSAPFERPRRSKWWNQGDYLACWADFDLDGRLDLALGSGAYPDDQRLRVYRQTEGGGFEEVSREWGIDFSDVWHLAADDIDGDGAVDLLVSGHPAEWSDRKAPVLALFRNRPDPGRHWLEVTLEGAGDPDGANRSAIGARVRVTAGGTVQTREVLSAAGHFGLAPPRRLHFGLGAHARVERLEVAWPDRVGSRQAFADLPADAWIHIRQGADPAPR
jgi:hypothetical protein